MTAGKKIMIIAGEVSGDLIGAGLVSQLKRINPQLYICGIGGDRMKEAGMELNFHIRDMAFLGFTEVIKHLPFIRRVRRQLVDKIIREKISLVVLIDYPGFNLNIARKIKALGLRVIYYVSPQVWAWGSGRVSKIRKFVDKMIVLFSFEEKFYKEHNIDVEFVGHPLLNNAAEYNFIDKDNFYKKFSLDRSKELLLLMPGSRVHEVSKLFPAMMKAAEKLTRELKLQIVVASSINMNDSIYREIYPGDYTIINGYTYELMKYSSAGIIKSGTSTLEAAYFELPMVIVYKTSTLTYLIGKNMIKVPDIGMANIIAGERIVPELIQDNATWENIYNEMKIILENKERLHTMKEKLRGVKLKLGEKGASERAAGIIINELQKV